MFPERFNKMYDKEFNWIWTLLNMQDLNNIESEHDSKSRLLHDHRQ